MRPPDAKVRLEALDPTRSFHLESPAGSGKTTLLAARYLLLLGHCRPEEVLAVTFTRKAAGELRERIVGAVGLAASGAEPRGEVEAQLVGLAREVVRRHCHSLAPEQLQVMTFHSLCGSLAERWPLEAGLTPGARVIDEAEQPALIREAVAGLRRDLLRGGGASRLALERRLLRLDNRWEALEEELSAIIAQRDLFEDLLRLVVGGGRAQALAAALEERVGRLVEVRLARARAALAQTALGQSWPQFVAELRGRGCELADLPAALPEAAAGQAAVWAQVADALLTKGGTPRKSLGPACGYPKGFGAVPFAAMIKDLRPACCSALALCRGLPGRGEAADLETLADLVTVAAEAVGRYERLCAAAGVMDFVGVEKAALRALAAEPFPQEGLLAMDARLRHVLVDEFQDTSRNQWLLIQRLCAGFTPEEGRTLFVVGDPKQSIYGFRKAEVALFEEARAGVPTEGGTLPLACGRLSANFRSRSGLVEWTNRVFERVMAEPFRAADEVPFAPSEAAREGPGELTLSLFAAEGAREREARWLAARVAEEAGRLAAGERLAVLLFARTHLPAYVRMMRQAGVAVSVREGLPLAERPEVAGLLSLARALVRPHDDLAWAALLRSPWGMVDAATFCAVAARRGEGWQEKLAGMADLRVAALYGTVARAQERLVGRLPLAEAVRRAWIDLHGPWESVCRLGPECLANCRAALDLLRQCEALGPPEQTLAAFEERLGGAYQPPLEDRPESPVQMMTVHRAKGLEFDVVFVPFLDWNPLGKRGRREPYLMERLPGGDHLVALPPDRRQAGADATWELVSRFAADRRLGEAKRLFYTAATRARRALHLSGAVGLKDGRLRPKGHSPLGWLLAAEGLVGAEPARLGAADLGGLRACVEPAPPPTPAREAAEAAGAGRPRFAPEPLSYRKLSASELGGEPAPKAGAQVAMFEPSLEARLRGTLIHRLLERAAQGPLPGEAQVAAALLEAGLAPARARGLAAELLAEVGECLKDPFLARALAAEERWCELALEGLAAGPAGPGRRLDVGTLDLLFRDGQTWWVVDYKTARPQPGEGEEAFCAAQADKYRPQMAAYRRLIAAWKGVPEQRVHLALYFTFLRGKVGI